MWKFFATCLGHVACYMLLCCWVVMSHAVWNLLSQFYGLILIWVWGANLYCGEVGRVLWGGRAPPSNCQSTWGFGCAAWDTCRYGCPWRYGRLPMCQLWAGTTICTRKGVDCTRLGQVGGSLFTLSELHPTISMIMQFTCWLPWMRRATLGRVGFMLCFPWLRTSEHNCHHIMRVMHCINWSMLLESCVMVADNAYPWCCNIIDRSRGRALIN